MKSDVEHDPRPDLAEDHGLWEGVLGLAKAEFPRRIGVYYRDAEGRWTGSWVTLYTLLHGLRCAGARLEIRESGNLRLNYKPALPEIGYTEDELRRYWLDPAKNRLKELFARAREIGEGRKAG